MRRSRGNLCSIHGQARLSFPVAKARSAKRTAKRSAPCGSSSEAPMSGRFPGHYARPLAAREVSGGAPVPVKPVCAVPKKKAMCLLGDPSVCTCKVGFSSGQPQKRTLVGGRVRTGCGSGDNRSGAHRGSQWRRIRRERGPAAGRPCPGAPHSAHPSRLPWSDHCGARKECAQGFDDPARGILELATTRKGTSSPPLRPFPHAAKGHRDGCRSIDKGRIGGFERHHSVLYQFCGILELTAKDSGHDLAWRWPLLGLSHLHARRSLSHRLAQGSDRARDGKEAVDGANWEGNVKGHQREPCRRRRQVAKSDSGRSEASPSSKAAGAGARAHKAKTAGQTETRSRP